MVEHQGLDAASLQAFNLGHDVVEIVQRLDPRRERGGADSLCGSGHDPQALLVELGRIEADRVSDHNHLGVAGFGRVEAQATRTAGDHQPDVAIYKVVGGQRVDDSLGHRFLADRNL